MTDQTHPSLGTVAEEAARLMAALATAARPSAARDNSGEAPNHSSSPYAGGPAHDPAPPQGQRASGSAGTDEPPDPQDGTWDEQVPCSVCGGAGGGTPVACTLCPLCQGIALLRSVRPETVDRLADLAAAMAASLRDLATQARASGPGSDDGSVPGRPSERGRATVQNIPVDDETQG